MQLKRNILGVLFACLFWFTKPYLYGEMMELAAVGDAGVEEKKKKTFRPSLVSPLSGQSMLTINLAGFS